MIAIAIAAAPAGVGTAKLPAAPTTAKTLVAPVVDPMPSATSNNPMAVSGTATADAEVRFYVNGTLLQIAVADTGGAFSANVPLYDGSNDIYAVAFDGQVEGDPSPVQTTVYTSTQPRQQSGTLSGDVVWTPSGGAYELTGHLTVAAGTELTLMPGVEVRSGYFNLVLNGSLVSLGTAASQVSLRASTPSSTWGGIIIKSTGYLDIQHTTVEKAGVGLDFQGGEGAVRSSLIQNSSVGVMVRAGSSPVFSDGYRIINNTQGIVVNGDNVEANNPQPQFVNGAIYGNYYDNYQTAAFGNGSHAVLVATGNWWGTADVSQIVARIHDQTDDSALPFVDFAGYLGALGGTPAHSGGFIGGTVTQDRTVTVGTYQVLGTIRIPQGVTLTVEPGTTFRFPSQYPRFAVDVHGTLHAHGTAQSPITLQSSLASPGLDWEGIRVYPTGVVDIEHAIVEHAYNGFYFAGGEGAVKSTVVRANNYGVYVGPESHPQFTDGFDILYNVIGVHVHGHASDASKNPAPAFTGGAIRLNSQRDYQAEGFVAGDDVVLDATGNWWGSTTASEIAPRIDDYSDDAVRPVVNFAGYTGAIGAAPIHPGAFLFGPIKTSRTLAAADYQVLGTVRVSTGAALTVPAGSTVRMPYQASLQVHGALLVQGAAGSLVHFRAEMLTGNWGSWSGISAFSSGQVEFDYALVEHVSGTGALNFKGGGGVVRHTTIQNSTYGVWMEGATSPQLLDGFVVRNNSEGIRVRATGAGNPTPVMRNGAIYANTLAVQTDGYTNAGNLVLDATENWWGTTDVRLIANSIVDNDDNAELPVINYSGYLNAEGGTVVHTGAFLYGRITADRTLAPGDYQVLGNLRVNSGAALTISPGSTIRMPAYSTAIDVSGLLIAHGTAEAPIVFRPATANPGRGAWAGIHVGQGGFVDFNHAVVEYAAWGALDFEGGDGEIRNTVLRNSIYGVRVRAGSSPEFFDSFAIVGNGDGVVIGGNGTPAGDPDPTFVQGAIYGNDHSAIKTEGYAAGASITLHCPHNWWGTNDPAVIKQRIVDRLDNASLPLVDYLDFKESLGGPSHLIAFDFVFPRRDVDALTGTTSRTEMMLNTAATVSFEVLADHTHEVVKTVTQAMPRGSHSFEWDGTDDAGHAVAEGMYRLRTTLNESSRQSISDPDPPSTHLDGSASIPSRFNAFRNEFLKVPYSTLGVSKATLTVVAPGSTFSPTVNHFAEANNAEWLYWDGRDPQGNLLTGELLIEFDGLRIRPHYLHVARAQPKITGLQPAPAIEVKSDPYLITHSYEQVSRFAFRIDTDAYVTVRLLPPGVSDLQSSQAITLLPEQLLVAETAQGSPQDHVVEWRGTEANDPNRLRTAAEGPYTFAISARSPVTNRTAVYRGVLQIYQ